MSKKEKSPAFQFYPKDWLSDSKVISMTPEARGLYIQLLCIDWLEDGIKPDQMIRLSGYDYHDKYGSLRDAEDVEALLDQLQPCFEKHPVKEGLITNPRLYKEREGQVKRAKERSEAGRRGGLKTQNKDKPKINQKPSSASNQLEAKSTTSSSSSPSSSLKEKDKKEKNEREKFKPPLTTEIIAHFISKGSNQSEADNFFNFYESKGWMVGKSKMKSWTAAANGWVSRNKPVNNTNNMQDLQGFGQKGYGEKRGI